MSKPPNQGPQLFAEIEVFLQGGESVKVEHCIHLIQLSPTGQGGFVIVEQARGDRRSYFFNVNEVRYLRLEPSKVDLA